MLKKAHAKINIETIMSILRNPVTDIIYNKTKTDPISQIQQEANLPAEELYKLLDIPKDAWKNKLQVPNQIPIKELLTLADKTGTSIELGRPTLTTPEFRILLDNLENFDKELQNSINEYVNLVNNLNQLNSQKGLFIRKCGSKIMQTLNSKDNIEKSYNLQVPVETLNQQLYALGICMEYSPNKSKKEQITQKASIEERTDLLIKNLKLVPYSLPFNLVDVMQKIDSLISETDSETFNLIFNIPPEEAVLEKLSIKNFIKLYVLSNEPEPTESKDMLLKDNYKEELDERLQDILTRITQIPEELIIPLAKKLHIRESYIREPIQNTDEKNNAIYFITMNTVTQGNFKFSSKVKEAMHKKYNEEHKIVKQITEKEHKQEAIPDKVTVSTELLPIQAEAQIEIPEAEPASVKKTTRKEKTVRTTARKTTSTRQRKTKTGQEITTTTKLTASMLSGAIFSLASKIYNVIPGEIFKYGNMKIQFLKEGKNPTIIADEYNQELDPEKNAVLLIHLLYGDKEPFRQIPYLPQNGDEYWSFNLLGSFEAVRYIYGENPYADAINQKYKIIFRSKSQLEAADLEEIKAKILQ